MIVHVVASPVAMYDAGPGKVTAYTGPPQLVKHLPWRLFPSCPVTPPPQQCTVPLGSSEHVYSLPTATCVASSFVARCKSRMQMSPCGPHGTPASSALDSPAESRPQHMTTPA